MVEFVVDCGGELCLVFVELVIDVTCELIWWWLLLGIVVFGIACYDCGLVCCCDDYLWCMVVVGV